MYDEKQDFLDFIQTKLHTGKYSKLFIDQLLAIEFDHTLLLDAVDFGSFRISTILNTVSYLEGLDSHSSTKKESQFEREILHPYFHKHIQNVNSDNYIILNAINSEKKMKDKIDKTIQYCNENNIDKDKFYRVLTYYIVDESINNAYKNNKVTGEWIVYEKCETHNFYLTLASHTEKDEEILKRINLCKRKN